MTRLSLRGDRSELRGRLSVDALGEGVLVEHTGERCVETIDRSEVAAVDAVTPRRRNDDAASTTSSVEGFLSAVGERVRHQRSLVHLSRRGLAARSGVSERYLAQLEAGQGNMSIVLLRRVALALDLPLADLVDENDSIDEAPGSVGSQRPVGSR